jgi:hypothetical protein
VLLLVGLTVGRLLHHTALGSFVADLALVPVVAFTHGANGALAAVAIVTALFAKRLAGNGRPPDGVPSRVWVNRLLYDADSPALSE